MFLFPFVTLRSVYWCLIFYFLFFSVLYFGPNFWSSQLVFEILLKSTKHLFNFKILFFYVIVLILQGYLLKSSSNFCRFLYQLFKLLFSLLWYLLLSVSLFSTPLFSTIFFWLYKLTKSTFLIAFTSSLL